jgi:hypothetical protein
MFTAFRLQQRHRCTCRHMVTQTDTSYAIALDRERDDGGACDNASHVRLDACSFLHTRAVHSHTSSDPRFADCRASVVCDGRGSPLHRFLENWHCNRIQGKTDVLPLVSKARDSYMWAIGRPTQAYGWQRHAGILVRLLPFIFLSSYLLFAMSINVLYRVVMIWPIGNLCSHRYRTVSSHRRPP